MYEAKLGAAGWKRTFYFIRCPPSAVLYMTLFRSILPFLILTPPLPHCQFTKILQRRRRRSQNKRNLKEHENQWLLFFYGMMPLLSHDVRRNCVLKHTGAVKIMNACNLPLVGLSKHSNWANASALLYLEAFYQSSLRLPPRLF